MTTMGLSQVITDLTDFVGHTFDLVFSLGKDGDLKV